MVERSRGELLASPPHQPWLATVERLPAHGPKQQISNPRSARPSDGARRDVRRRPTASTPEGLRIGPLPAAEPAQVSRAHRSRRAAVNPHSHMSSSNPPGDGSARSCALWRVQDGLLAPAADQLAIEEPLEIQLRYLRAGLEVRQTVAITMRTPGCDRELAVGFLCTEGILTSPDEIEAIEESCAAEGAQICVHVRIGVQLDLTRLQRHGTVTSACGACGKTSLRALRIDSRFTLEADQPALDPEAVHRIPAAVRAGQAAFAQTGGLHAAALCTSAGEVLAVYEDVGRHNAVDKLIGAEFLRGRLPLASAIVFVSSRASFELVQKAAMAGVPVLAAVGAPSSLAVELARASGLTLLGFVRDRRFNVYAGVSRLPQLLHSTVAA